MWKCFECHHDVDDDCNYCLTCGTDRPTIPCDDPNCDPRFGEHCDPWPAHAPHEHMHLHKPQPMQPIPARPVSPYNPSSTMSLWGEVDKLRQQVNSAVAATNQAAHCLYDTARQISSRAIDEKAYYNPHDVIAEEGYSAEMSAKYTIIRLKDKDCEGFPIRVQLRPAYSNTTNSGIKEECFTASHTELADKLFSAIPAGSSWYGIPFLDGRPLPSTNDATRYTVGFTKRGTLKVYDNALYTAEQLRRDCITDAMGCAGIICNDGKAAHESQYNLVPGYKAKQSRVCMGQNYDSKETFFLVTGFYDNPGMTTLACGEILARYGCTIAVEICQGASAAALDKGKLIVTPDDATIPETNAYWFISRKCIYRKKSTFEIAIVMQKLGVVDYRSLCNSYAIKDLQFRMDNAEDNIQELFARVGQLEKDVVKLREDLTKEIADRIAADKALQAEIDALEALLQKLTETVNGLISDMQNLNRLYAGLVDRMESIEADQTAINGRLDHLLTHMETLDTTMASLLEQWAQQSLAFADIKEAFALLNQLVNTFDSRIVYLEGLLGGIEEIPERLAAIEDLLKQLEDLPGDLAALLAMINEMKPRLDDVERRLTMNESVYGRALADGPYAVWKFGEITYGSTTKVNMHYTIEVCRYGSFCMFMIHLTGSDGTKATSMYELRKQVQAYVDANPTPSINDLIEFRQPFIAGTEDAPTTRHISYLYHPISGGTYSYNGIGASTETWSGIIDYGIVSWPEGSSSSNKRRDTTLVVSINMRRILDIMPETAGYFIGGHNYGIFKQFLVPSRYNTDGSLVQVFEAPLNP